MMKFDDIMKKIELLAPAGSMEAMQAAISFCLARLRVRP